MRLPGSWDWLVSDRAGTKLGAEVLVLGGGVSSPSYMQLWVLKQKASDISSLSPGYYLPWHLGQGQWKEVPCHSLLLGGLG